MDDSGTPARSEAFSIVARIGLIYQGRYHRIVIEALLEKILGANTEVVSLMGDSWPQILGDLIGLLRALERQHDADPLCKVLVVVDADKVDPASRENALREKVGNRTFRFGTVHYHAILREIETWLLGDPDALNAAADRRLPRTANPEGQLGPKNHLIQKLKNAGVDYAPDFVRKAAVAIDVDRLRANCPRFQTFRQQVTDC